MGVGVGVVFTGVGLSFCFYQGWEGGTFYCSLGNKLGEIVNRECSGEGVRGEGRRREKTVCLSVCGL